MEVRKVDELFARYAQSHQNPVNKAIHWVCVPLITWSVLALIWAWSPVAAYGFIAAALVFYAWLSPALAIGMLGVTAALVYPLTLLGPHVLPVAIAVFVVAWIGQFIGHRIEGRKPSFFDATFTPAATGSATCLGSRGSSRFGCAGFFRNRSAVSVRLACA